MELHESIGLANGTSGNAVVFAGSTVLIALLALNVTGIPFLGVMGTVGAVCVLVAVLIAVTLTPALLGLVGARVLLAPRSRDDRPRGRTPRTRLRPMPTWRAVVRAVLAVVALLVIAIPALSMRLGLPDGSSEAEDSTQYQAYTIVAEEFGAGQNGPLLVVADAADDPVADDAVARPPRRTSPSSSWRRTTWSRSPRSASPTTTPTSPSRWCPPTARRASRPSSSCTTCVRCRRSRAASSSASPARPAATSTSPRSSPPRCRSTSRVVIGLSLLIMIVVFRSLLVPLIATAGFVLSLFAAFGAVVAVYQWGWLGRSSASTIPGPVLNFVPIILVGVLFGLAMDYQLFLVSGMREAYVHGAPARAGRRRGRARRPPRRHRRGDHHDLRVRRVRLLRPRR